jgi:hypothetical protein
MGELRSCYLLWAPIDHAEAQKARITCVGRKSWIAASEEMVQ